MVDQVKLSYNAGIMRVKCEFTKSLVLQLQEPPADLFSRAKTKLESLKSSGLIGFYVIYENRINDVWKALRQNNDEPVDRKFIITLGGGAPIYSALRLVKSQTEKAAALLSVDIPKEQTSGWKYEWFKLNIYRLLRDLGINEMVNNAQIYSAFLKVTIKGEALKGFPLILAQQVGQSPQGKKIAVLANKTRREIALVIRDVKELKQKESLDAMNSMIDQAVKQLSVENVKYRVLTKDLNLALQTAFDGPESLGLEIPLILLAALGEVQESQTEMQSGSKSQAIDLNYPGAGRLTLVPTPDRMEVTIAGFSKAYYADKSFKVNLDWIRKELDRCQLRLPLAPEIIKDLSAAIEKQETLNGKLVLKGIPSSGGKEPYLHLRYLESGISKPEANLESDSLDIRDLQQRQIVKEGQLIAELLFKIPQVKGYDVYGTELPPAANDELIITLGEGVTQRDNGKFYATFVGIPVVENNSISLSKMLVHEGDVNLRSGNIRFEGPVEIKGSIDSGSTVNVSGDLIVHGEIRGAFVEVKGNIQVKSGVSTGDQGHIYCGGNFSADFVENSKLTVRGDLKVKRALINSQVVCGGSITVTSNEGVLAGGKIIVKQNLRTPNLGFQRGAVTVLDVGVDWKVARAVNIRKERLERVIAKQQVERQNLRELVQKTKAHQTPKQKTQKEELQERLTRMRILCERLDAQIIHFQSLLTYNMSARIYVILTLMANVNMTIGGQIVAILSDVANVCVLPKRRRGSFIAPLEEIENEEKAAGSDLKAS